MNFSTSDMRANFIRSRVRADIEKGDCAEVVTRFPPEPNGYLHIGHAKAALLSASLATEFGGRFLLRLDDTNPENNYERFAGAIEDDLRWLGCTWHGAMHYTSDYFQQLYDYAERLIAKNLAYICDLDAEQIRVYRGTLNEAGKNSPYRDRSIEENMKLFALMRSGNFKDGTCVLRARIDMSSPNINMRDPVLYRIRNLAHPRTATQWCIYPTYDFSHSLCDAIEGITHSLCTLEFQDHRPLYEWLLNMLDIKAKPQQIEFAKLNLEGVVTSKRHIKTLVTKKLVMGWDDPRLVTLAGLRRRGCVPAALHHFCQEIGVAKSESKVRFAQLEHSMRTVLQDTAPRAMCVLRPLKVRLSNWPSESKKQLHFDALPDGATPKLAKRTMEFAGEFYIEQDDFSLAPPKGYKRLTLNQPVRLRGAWVIHCEEIEYDAAGQPILLHCRYDAETLGVKPDYKIGGVIHWVAALNAVPVAVRLFTPLLGCDADASDIDFEQYINQNSVTELKGCLGEPSIASMVIGEVRQFERQGYFCVDSIDSNQKLLLNRAVALRANPYAHSKTTTP